MVARTRSLDPLEVYDDGEGLEIVQRLSRDLRNAGATLRQTEARYLVDVYYSMQEQRIRADAQVKAAETAGEPNSLLVYSARQYRILEDNARKALAAYADASYIGRWSQTIVGIGPVLAAGLLAHIDMEPWLCAEARLNTSVKKCSPDAPHGPACRQGRLNVVSPIWRFAGLDPTVTWEKGKKRPWNADLKVLCWKIGKSFVFTSSRQGEFYGTVYRERKQVELENNERGVYAELAAHTLATKRYGEDTIARGWYEQGKLPPGHIDARAQRYAVKLFLSHWHHVAFETLFGEKPPRPYVIEHLGHQDYIAPPNWPAVLSTTEP